MNQHALTILKFKCWGISHWNFANECQIRRQGIGCAERIPRADGVAIYSRALEFRQGMRRKDILR